MCDARVRQGGGRKLSSKKKEMDDINKSTILCCGVVLGLIEDISGERVAWAGDDSLALVDRDATSYRPRFETKAVEKSSRYPLMSLA